MRGIITPIHRRCIDVTESHIRAFCGERKGKGKEGTRERDTSPCTYKALASVYITYVVQFHDVSLQFRHDGFSTITRPYFSLSPRPPLPRSFYHLPSSPLSLVNFHSVSFSLSSAFPVSGAAHHFVNQDKLEISCRGTGFDSAEYIGRQRYIRSYQLVIKYPLLRIHTR